MLCGCCRFLLLFFEEVESVGVGVVKNGEGGTSECSAPLDFCHVVTGSYTYHQEKLLLFLVQELCESRGGRPGLSVPTSLLVSVDVKLY